MNGKENIQTDAQTGQQCHRLKKENKFFETQFSTAALDHVLNMIVLNTNLKNSVFTAIGKKVSFTTVMPLVLIFIIVLPIMVKVVENQMCGVYLCGV